MIPQTEQIQKKKKKMMMMMMMMMVVVVIGHNDNEDGNIKKHVSLYPAPASKQIQNERKVFGGCFPSRRQIFFAVKLSSNKLITTCFLWLRKRLTLTLN